MDWKLNLFWCIIGALLSLLISIIIHFIGLKRKHISYSIETTCLILNEINQIDGLDIKYMSKKIKNLYTSTIVLENVGNSNIESTDLAPSYPLSLITDGKFLFNTKLLMKLIILTY